MDCLLTVPLDEQQEALLGAKARQQGLSPEQLAAQLIAQQLALLAHAGLPLEELGDAH